MTVLLLRLSGPLQSWGASSRHPDRGTQGEPTRSGVLGLLAAARGMRRTDPLEDLLTLRFGVRKDQPGELLRDFHTTHTLSGAAMPLSYRYYLTDAVFVAALEGDPSLLAGLQSAVKEPAFPLYLGRRSCVPAGPLSVGLHDGTIEQALTTVPWQASEWWRKRKALTTSTELEILLDKPNDDTPGQGIGAEEAFVQRDVPRGWDPRLRDYGWRTVYRAWVRVAELDDAEVSEEKCQTQRHDPMAVFGG